ncbi:hypothetical protein [Bradyrhizobium sp. Leo121]|nr:hypothetical protein [Bradyrhizobium sp. Leo121]
MTSMPSTPGNSRVTLLSSTTFRKNCTFESMMPLAQLTTMLMFWPSSFLD